MGYIGTAMLDTVCDPLVFYALLLKHHIYIYKC